MADFAREIVEYFLARRGQGTAVSGEDEDLILRWEAAGWSLHQVLEGIDEAFERRVERPRSIAQCARWVRARNAADQARHGASPSRNVDAALGEATSSLLERPDASSSEAPAKVDERSEAERILERIHRRARTLSHEAARSAYAQVHEELAPRLVGESQLPDELRDLLDAALVEASLSALPKEQLHRLQADVVEATASLEGVLGASALARRREILMRERLDETLGGLPSIFETTDD